MLSRRNRWIFAGCALFPVAVAWGDLLQKDPREDRRDRVDSALVGDTAVLADEGDLELTFGVSFESEDELDSTEMYVDIQYGLKDWLQLTIVAPYKFVSFKEEDEPNVDGRSDLELSLDVAVLNDPIPLVAALMVGLPTGNDKRSEELGEGVTVWQPTLTTELGVGDFELVVEVGGEFTRHSSAFIYETALAYEVGGIVPSLGLEGSLGDDGSNEMSLVPGIGFELIEDVDLAIEAPVGLTRDSADWGVTIEVTIGF